MKYFIIPLILSLFLYNFFKLNLLTICEVDFDSETHFCEENISLQSNSFVEFFSNYFSVKYVFYGSFNNQNVVVKKLRGDLKQPNSDLYSDTNTNFQICPPSLLADFLGLISMNNLTMAMYWHSVLRVNAEPLLLQVLKTEHGWPVPQYLGMYGLCFVESHCGVALNAFKNADWYVRAELALQILEAAKRFTDRHPNFRFYLTDVSPDNIAVSDNLKVTFVDLENVIVTGRHNANLNPHISERFEDVDSFAFSESAICNSSISDHNYYAICKLLLSDRAPWPMMEGGLLHTPHTNVVNIYPHLIALIHSCSHGVNCFDAVEKIIVILQSLANVNK